MPYLLYFAVEHPNLGNGRQALRPCALAPLDQIEDVMAGWAMSRIGREPTMIEVINNLIPSFPCIPYLEEVYVGPEDPRKGLVGQLDVRIKPASTFSLEPGSIIGSVQARHRFLSRQEDFQNGSPPSWYKPSLPVGYDPGIKKLEGWPEVRPWCENEASLDRCLTCSNVAIFIFQPGHESNVPS